MGAMIDSEQRQRERMTVGGRLIAGVCAIADTPFVEDVENHFAGYFNELAITVRLRDGASDEEVIQAAKKAVPGSDDSKLLGPIMELLQSVEGKSVAGPFDVNVTNEGGLLRMTVGVHWSLWTDPNDPGWPELAKALERIQQTGWRCTYSEIDGLGERDA